MPWGCIGNSKLGDGSGPGNPNCGIPGSFATIRGVIPAKADAIDVTQAKAGTA